MRAGKGLAFGLVFAGAATGPALADAIVKIVNNATSAVTVRIDGGYGCRAQAKAAAPDETDKPNECTFGTSAGEHTLGFEFDGGRKSSTRSITVPATGYALTLTGAE
jgi:hypothetical protein